MLHRLFNCFIAFAGLALSYGLLFLSIYIEKNWVGRTFVSNEAAVKFVVNNSPLFMIGITIIFITVVGIVNRNE